MNTHRIVHGDCLDVMRGMPDNSVDAIVCDPPAGVNFMSAKWDNDKGGRRQWIAWLADVMREAMRIIKPGGHALVWSLPRTSHWTGTALEDAGWQIRDCVTHIFGSGFPKSLNISKAIDKAAGAERDVIGIASDFARDGSSRSADNHAARSSVAAGLAGDADNDRWSAPITAPATDDAKRWQGYGSALKPAVETWWLCRKPLDGTIAGNVLKHGVGGLNIDGCRIESDGSHKKPDIKPANTGNATSYQAASHNGLSGSGFKPSNAEGRFPANLLLTHAIECDVSGSCVPWCAAAEMDRQSGSTVSKSGGIAGWQDAYVGGEIVKPVERQGQDDAGGASRFFARFRYQSKPSTAERDTGLESMPLQQAGLPMRSADVEREGVGGDGTKTHRQTSRRNVHPTVKSIALMRWLVRLVTPPSGIVLDPFAGSGTTGIAAALEGCSFIGIEQSAQFADIARRRIAHHTQQGQLF